MWKAKEPYPVLFHQFMLLSVLRKGKHISFSSLTKHPINFFASATTTLRKMENDPKRIDGKAMSEQIHTELQQEVEKLKSKGVVPGLAVILVGDRYDFSYLSHLRWTMMK